MKKLTFPVIIQEIIAKSNLEEHVDSLIFLDEQIKSRGFKITTREDSIQSVIEWDNKIIRLSVVNGRKRKLEVLWDLLHEFGHLLDYEPIANNNTQKFKREITAWRNAKNTLLKLPKLVGFINEFENYSSKCLKTYKYIM